MAKRFYLKDFDPFCTIKCVGYKKQEAILFRDDDFINDLDKSTPLYDLGDEYICTVGELLEYINFMPIRYQLW